MNEVRVLRKKLDKISELDLFNQIDFIDDLKKDFSHSINLIHFFSKKKSPDQYNCFTYAFDLKEEKKIGNIKQNKINWNNLVLQMIENKIIIKDPKGSLIIYFKKSIPKHAGRLIDENMVVSKWGCGHLWQHKILEVLASYGEPVSYKVVDPSEILKIINIKCGKE